MIIYLERHNGQIKVKQIVKTNLHEVRDLYRTIKTVKDTPANYADILRWADAVGHEVEEL